MSRPDVRFRDQAGRRVGGPGGSSGACESSSATWIILAVVVVVGVGILAGLVVLLIPKGQSEARKVMDLNDLRQLAGLVVITAPRGDPPLAPDGRIDVYSILMEEALPEEELVDLCTSDRTGEGPTAAEIAAGSYTNFPWQRRKGGWELTSEAHLLLWEKSATDGRVLVANSAGSAREIDEAELERFLREHPAQR